MKRFFTNKVLYIVLIAIFLSFVDLPANYQTKLFSNTPQSFLDQKFHLGLDLQGGTQLDYSVDLTKVPDVDKNNVVEGVKEVITKRVNNLGVAEANIFTSSIEGEEHIIVELPGIKDIEEAKNKVGKVILLEFKEENTEISESAVQEIKKNAENILAQSTAPEADFSTICTDEARKNQSRVKCLDDSYKFREEFGESSPIADKAFSTEPGKVINELIDSDGNYNIVKVEGKKQGGEDKAVKVSHLLVSYEGSRSAASDITRTKEEAKTRAEEALNKIKNEGKTFEDMVKDYSDEPGAKDRNGLLAVPVIAVDKGGLYEEKFTEASLKLENKGQLSEIIETDFGFHIIRAEEINPPRVQIKYLSISTEPDPWKETGLGGDHFIHADVEFGQGSITPYVTIQFNDEGAKLFKEITERNVNKRVAIFVGGEEISAPNVNEVIPDGKAQISGNFTPEEANNLARDLNTGAIPAPIEISGQNQIGASLGQDALNKSLKAGIIGLLVLGLFMLLYYRMPGMVANIALVIYSIILLFLIKIALPMPYAIGISVALFAAIVVKIINSKDAGLEKMISFLLACVILFFLSFILTTPIVLTLSGVAGLILSIGMAVDANILIFERIKEELKSGKPLNLAVESGFERAWLSIRDSNFSSLITCGILFFFGSSLIRGFALTLSMGILVSMFSAITVTKGLLLLAIKSKFLSTPWMFGLNVKSNPTKFNFIGKKNVWFGFSGLLIAISIVSLLITGAKFGLDFTGGTLMEVHFDRNVSEQELKTALTDAQNKINETLKQETGSEIEESNNQTESPLITPDTAFQNETSLNLKSQNGNLELEKATITKIDSTEENKSAYILKTKHLSNESHTAIIETFKKNLGSLEETRFTTIGATIGDSLKKKAVLALALALIMIILYIAFAFRKIPKSVNPWRFGASAVFALIHDVIITIGAYILFTRFFGVEIDALFVTALLTIIGFSVHDTIVVFDRIRENLRFKTHEQSFDQIANISLNQTLARSINTSFTTFVTLLFLLIFGSESITFFIATLIVGIVIGTYSSIFIASPILVTWNEYANKQAEAKKLLNKQLERGKA